VRRRTTFSFYRPFFLYNPGPCLIGGPGRTDLSRKRDCLALEADQDGYRHVKTNAPEWVRRCAWQTTAGSNGLEERTGELASIRTRAPFARNFTKAL
jgi:hypothetical protein